MKLLDVNSLKTNTFEPQDAQWVDLKTDKNLKCRWRGLGLNNEVIAVVGTKYNYIPNSRVLQLAEQAFRKSGVNLYPYQQSHDKSNRIHKFIYISDQKFKIHGEEYYVSLTIKDSYGGATPLEGQLALYRELCSNGLFIGKTTKDEFKVRHTLSLTEALLLVDFDLIFQRLNKDISRIESLINIPVGPLTDLNDPILKKLIKNYGSRIAKYGVELYHAHYQNEMGANGYALMNAFTEYSSHEIKSFTGRESVEKKTTELFLNRRLF